MPSARPNSKTRRTPARPAARVRPALLALALAACADTGEAEKLDRMIAAQAEAAERAGDTGAALRHYGALYEADPANEAAIEGLARTLRRSGDPQKAWSLVAEALDRLGERPRLLLERGKAELALGHADKAVVTLTAAGAAAPTAWEPPATLAVALDRLGRYEEAARRYGDALRLNPGHADTLNNFALSRALSGHIDDGVALLRNAVGLPGASAKTRENLAFLEDLRTRGPRPAPGKAAPAVPVPTLPAPAIR